MKRLAWLGLRLGAAWLWGLSATLACAAEPPVRDFLVMDVCVDEQDRPVAGSPLSCPRHRDLRDGEAIDYAPADHPEADDKRCFARGGYVRRFSFGLPDSPTTRTSQRIVLSVVDRGGAGEGRCDAQCTCREPVKDARFGQWDAEHDGVSVITYNPSLAWIMASKAQDRASYFLGSDCARPGARGLERFNPTWVLGPSGLPPVGSWGAGIFRSRLSVNQVPEPRDCTGHRSSFIAWTRGEFAFGAGSEHRLEALVSDKYANAGPQNPGEAMQVERSYWTRELGISRWEKWERVDHERRDQRDVDEQARKIVRQAVCGKPYGPGAQVTPSLRYGPVTLEDGHYAREVVQTDASGRPSRHRWVMVDCADWTHVQRVPSFVPGRLWNENRIPEVMQVLR